MSLRPILLYPDPRLTCTANPVTDFDGALTALAGDLLETMRAAPGIGITGPHVGAMLAITVIELDPSSGVRTYVNPEILRASAETARHREGSVSMPGFMEDVDRPAHITVRYRTLDGTVRHEDADGLMAVCLQHEIDQLNGIFWVQRLSRLKRERLLKRYAKR